MSLHEKQQLPLHSSSQRLDWRALLAQKPQATAVLRKSPFGSGQQQQQQQGTPSSGLPSHGTPPSPSTPQGEQLRSRDTALLPILLLKASVPEPVQAKHLHSDTPLEQQLQRLRELQATSTSLMSEAAAAAQGTRHHHQQQEQQQQQREDQQEKRDPQQRQDAAGQKLQAAAQLLARPIPAPEHVPADDVPYWTGTDDAAPRAAAAPSAAAAAAGAADTWPGSTLPPSQQQPQQQLQPGARGASANSSGAGGSSMSTGGTFSAAGAGGRQGSGLATTSMATSSTRGQPLHAGPRGTTTSGGGGGGLAATPARSPAQQWESALARLQQLRAATEEVLGS